MLHRAGDLAERYLEAGLEHCAVPDLDLWRLSILSIKVRNELNRGRWDAAAELATALADDHHESGEPRLAGLLVLALVRARRGDPGARAALAQAFESTIPLTSLRGSHRWRPPPQRSPGSRGETTRSKISQMPRTGLRSSGRLPG